MQAKEGDNLLDVVINNDIDIDGYGACEGTLACSTCHLIFTPEDFSKIEEEATDEELDMLDLAYGLTDTSRLGCQAKLQTEVRKDFKITEKALWPMAHGAFSLLKAPSSTFTFETLLRHYFLYRLLNTING